MRKVYCALCLVTLGVVLSVTTFAAHVVRTSDGLLILWKRRPGLKDAYVDVRGWSVTEWNRHRELVQALQDAGYEDRLPEEHRYFPQKNTGAQNRLRSRTAGKRGEAASSLR